MPKELDKGLLLVRNLDVYEASLGNREAICLARRWRSLAPEIRERAREWSKPVIEELFRMTRAEQVRCVAEFDRGDFKSIDGAVLGEDTAEQDVREVVFEMLPAMKEMLANSYGHISELKECAEEIVCVYKREAMLYQLSRIEGVLEAWSKTPKEMLNVQAEC